MSGVTDGGLAIRYAATGFVCSGPWSGEMKRFVLFLCFTIILVCFSGCIDPQRFVALETRVASMEMENNRQMARDKKLSKDAQDQLDKQRLEMDEQLKAIREQIAGKPQISREEFAELGYNLQAVKEDLQRLEGMIEEIRYSLEQQKTGDNQDVEKQLERLDQAISRNYEKVLRLEKYMGFEPTVAAGPVEPVTPPELGTGTVVDNEQQLYATAKKMFDDGDYANARIQFGNFINRYPDSKNADNARFWIADSYYTEKWYEKAILEYQEVLDNYPDSNKLAAARLKQGYAFAALGEIANARLILRELIKKHPDSNEAKYAAEKLKNLK